MASFLGLQSHWPLPHSHQILGHRRLQELSEGWVSKPGGWDC